MVEFLFVIVVFLFLVNKVVVAVDVKKIVIEKEESNMECFDVKVELN